VRIARRTKKGVGKITYKAKFLKLRIDRANQLLYEAEEICLSDPQYAKKVINDAIGVLHGQDDFIITKSKQKPDRKEENKKDMDAKTDRIDNVVHIKCLDCSKKWRVYKIKDKWILKCECGKVIVYDGEPTTFARQITRAEFEAIQ
jgi:ribosomal protein S27E